MLRASPPLSAGQASHYYRSEFSRGDYYAERDSEGIVFSRWHGRGAERLGLSGRVKADQFQHLLEGQEPSGRKVLVAHREGLDERRAGWDVTISPHKSVSLQALVGGDHRILEAHDKAVEKAVAELERHVQAWVHGGRDRETTGTLVAASFRHETSRALDPQLHSHCVFLNMTRRLDGEWRAVDARGFFRAQRLAREIYEGELGKELRELGYEICSYRDGRSGRDRAVGIAGFKEEHLRHFSKRSREIEKALQAKGLKSRLHGSRVSVATRGRKEKGVDREALLWKWRTAAREMSLSFPKPDRALLKARDALWRRDPDSLARTAMNGAVAHLSERKAVFRVADLEREAMSRVAEKGITIEEIRRAIAWRNDVLVIDRKDAVIARATTSQAIDEERALLALAERGRGRGIVIPAQLKPPSLGEDQLQVVRHVLESPDRLLAVEGKAGSGKTRALSVVRDHAEHAGLKVRGFAPTTTAVGVLREGGIDAVTVSAALREAPTTGAKAPELWIVDEAGLLSSRQATELLERADAKGAKVVLVGDRAQHRAVEAGSPFELLVERGKIPTDRLDVVRRHRDEGLRRTVAAASERGGVAHAVELLERAGRVVEIPDLRPRHAQIARDFVSDGGRGVVIAPSNFERQDLNRRIREALIEAGQVERQSIKVQVVVKQDVTQEQKSRVETFSHGDVLRFIRGGRGIEAGERACVIGIDRSKNELWLEVEKTVGRLCVINPKYRSGFELERVETRRLAVGDRIQFRAQDRALDVANGTIGTIKKVDHERGMATVEVGSRRFPMDLKEPKALDHAYAVTSHKSQGLSRERVYLTVDTSHSEELVNRRQFYVGVSRAVEDVRVYTDDRLALVCAVSREQSREGALEVLDRSSQRGVESRVMTLRRETPLDLWDRSPHALTDRGRDVGGRGNDRRDTLIDRGDEAFGRGGEASGSPSRRTLGPERSRPQSEERVPGAGHTGTMGPDRTAGGDPRKAAGRGRPPGEGTTRTTPSVARGHRDAPVGGDQAARTLADGPGAARDAGRGLPGSRSGQLPLWVDLEREGSLGRTQSVRVSRFEPGQVRRTPERPPLALSREEIARSAELQRRYATEYRLMLGVVPDREVAREAARVNVSALAVGQPRIVPTETGGPAWRIKDVIAQGGRDLNAIRRAVDRLFEHAVPVIGRPRPREFSRGPER